MGRVDAGTRAFTTPLQRGVDALRGYSGSGGRLLDQVRTNHHLLRAVTGELHHPRRLHAAMRGYADALVRQGAIFTSTRIDDVTDAMRHIGAMGLMTRRVGLLGRTGTDDAAALARRIGRAHERDSRLQGARRALSEAMDLHNNALGIELGRASLQRSPVASRAADQALEGAALRAIADGRARVLDAPLGPVRASTEADLLAVLADRTLLPR